SSFLLLSFSIILPYLIVDLKLCNRTIYSTNLIESFNKQIKKYSHRKEQFQNEESMERFLVSSFDTYNQKFLGRSHKGFQQAEGELEQMLSQLREN
ncbi:transposase, partial [Enterococcus faecium]|uniref:transposase n=2 Tax=Enterococcus TaxID=1350 RepID=UPI002542ACA0